MALCYWVPLVIDLLKSMAVKDPKRRPTASKLLERAVSCAIPSVLTFNDLTMRMHSSSQKDHRTLRLLSLLSPDDQVDAGHQIHPQMQISQMSLRNGSRRHERRVLIVQPSEEAVSYSPNPLL